MTLQKPPKPIRNKAHLKFVASLPCCISTAPDPQVHHLLRGTGEKCGNRKSGDNWVIPLRHDLHTKLHAGGDETGFLKVWNIDGPALAKQLWDATGNYERACAILRGDGNG